MVLLLLFPVIGSVMLCASPCCLLLGRGAFGVAAVWRSKRNESLECQPTEIDLKRSQVHGTNAYTGCEVAGSSWNSSFTGALKQTDWKSLAWPDFYPRPDVYRTFLSTQVAEGVRLIRGTLLWLYKRFLILVCKYTCAVEHGIQANSIARPISKRRYRSRGWQTSLEL